MDYEKAYKQALERARNLKEMYPQDAAGYEEVFPELREIEDEKIRKDIIGGLMWQRDNLKSEGPHDNNLILPGFCLTVGKHLSYLEKQKEQKPVETSDFKTKLAEYLQNNSPKDGQYVISSESILEMAKEELIKRGIVVEREQCCMGIKGDPDPAGVWKPTEEQMKAIDFARRVVFETYPSLHNGCEPYHILGELYEQLKKL